MNLTSIRRLGLSKQAAIILGAAHIVAMLDVKTCTFNLLRPLLVINVLDSQLWAVLAQRHRFSLLPVKSLKSPIELWTVKREFKIRKVEKPRKSGDVGENQCPTSAILYKICPDAKIVSCKTKSPSKHWTYPSSLKRCFSTAEKSEYQENWMACFEIQVRQDSDRPLILVSFLVILMVHNTGLGRWSWSRLGWHIFLHSTASSCLGSWKVCRMSFGAGQDDGV